MEAFADDLLTTHPPAENRPRQHRPPHAGQRATDHVDDPRTPANPVARLTRRRAELRLRLALLDPAVDPLSPGEGGDLAEEAQDHEYERRLAAMRRMVRAEIVQVELAMERAARGLYGICADCGHPIAPRRLEVVPAASLCVRCQAHREALGLVQ